MTSDRDKRPLFQAISLGLPFTIEGEEVTAVHVWKPTVRQLREWSANPDEPSPMVRTPKGRRLTDADLEDILQEDADRIADAVTDFFPRGRLAASAATVTAEPSLSPPSSPPNSPASETPSTSIGSTPSNLQATPSTSPAAVNAG